MLRTGTFLVLYLMLFSTIAYAQSSGSFWQDSDTLNIKRRNAIYITEAAAASATLIGLNQLWYANHPRADFHFLNDNNEWLQMDKMGHVMSAYYTGKVGMNLLQWAGESKKSQLVYGATLGFAFLTTVEVLDGFSEEWGFSTGDMLANATGTGLLIGQELLWDEQRIILKYSFHTTKYAEMRPEALGANFLERTLKDYNGQTYWLSANIASLTQSKTIPKWLNLAIGYGADGMLYGNPADQATELGKRQRQFYMSFDIDLTKIQTSSRFLKTLFTTINFIKIPAPTLEITANGKLKGYALYF